MPRDFIIVTPVVAQGGFAVAASAPVIHPPAGLPSVAGPSAAPSPLPGREAVCVDQVKVLGCLHGDENVATERFLCTSPKRPVGE